MPRKSPSISALLASRQGLRFGPYQLNSGGNLTTVNGGPASVEGTTYTQDNTGSNVPDTLVDPTVPASPVSGDATVQKYSDAVVLSVYDGSAWDNVKFEGGDSDPAYFPGDNGQSLANKVNVYLAGESVGAAPPVTSGDIYTTAVLTGSQFRDAKSYVSSGGIWIQVVEASTNAITTAEHLTGAIWTDGKPIYRQIISATLGNAITTFAPLKTSANADIPITGYIDKIIPSTNFIASETAGSINICSASDFSAGVQDNASVKSVFHATTADYSAYTGVWSVEYTKV